MKKTLLFSLFIILTNYISAQVTFDVNAIEIDQPVTITVDVNSNGSDCNGLSNPNKVYMHSGVGDNTNPWGFNVIGNWGQDDGVGEMTNNGDGTFSITITPQTYFGLTQTQADNATQIGMVFRNEDGSQELKDNGCEDYIFPIGIVVINFTQPTTPSIVIASGDNISINATIDYQGSTTVLGTFEVFYNDVSVATGTCGFPNCGTTLTNITESGIVKFVGTAPGTSETGEASFEVIVAPTVVEQALPNGMVDGINYDESDATKTTLVIDAPNKDFIYVAGSFNNYNPDNSFLMKKDPTTGKFWLELTGLTSGQVETYQYWVYALNPVANSPTIVKTADPYSTLVLSPFDDPWISDSTFPGLNTTYAYPSGQEREVTVLQTGQTPYNWQVTNFNKPKKEDLIIYEVLIRDFDTDRNYQDLIDKIDYFKDLNINAIQLMPVMEYEGNESWGYNTSFHLALDKYYGTADKFKEFIDLCHQNGIAVILDVALNHAFGRNPMNRMWMNDPDNDGWGEPSSENPYFNQTATHSYSVGSDFNHQQSRTQNYVERVVKHWIEEFNIDGFRWDLTKGFTQNCQGSDGCTNGYQQDRVDILKQYADYSWSLDPNHYVIFEHLGANSEESEWANYRIGEGKGIMLWGKMTDPYNQLTMGYNSNNNINGMGHNSRGWTGKRLVGYAESHDEERLMYKNVEFGNSGIGGNLNTSLGRMDALGAVSLTIPGPKMIWHFGELGMNNSIFTCNDGSVNNPDCKLDTKPQPQWIENWTTNANRSEIFDAWSRINELKINEAVFEGDYTINSGNLTPSIYIWDNSLPASQLKNVVIISNFNTSSTNINPNFPYGGTWYDLMDETGNTTISGSTTSINLAPGDFKIYGNAVPTLSNGSITENNLLRVYPNPTSTSFKINKNVTEVLIFDITGKQVKSFVGGFNKNNVFSIQELVNSIYILKIKDLSGNVQTTKLVKH
ncbi:alpha-amylase family glycosyl hydrolase [Pontimicrobium sp. IMCC45349]|uniref:alpha-amylase family glycosyl hydrolase n=1 Tax=Pontimicrobium sp. IMCC45349 TaxID=3391574 RepID=UPI0039A175FD